VLARAPRSRQRMLASLVLRQYHEGSHSGEAMHNKSIETDAQVRPCALRTRLVCAAHFRR